MIEIKVIIRKEDSCEWIVSAEEDYRNCVFTGYGETKEEALVHFGMCVSEMVEMTHKEEEEYPKFKFNFVER